MAGAEVNRPAVTDTPPAIPVMTADGCELELRHDRGPAAPEDRPAVLLVHGASAGSDTFRIGEEQTLVDYLLGQGLDVWTLDWRASMRRVRDVYCKAVYERRLAGTFTIDAAADHDVPAAIEAMRREPQNVRGKIAVLGHCMGGAIVAQGMARGTIPSADVENVVLTALGLFYRAAIDNVLKAEDQVLEGLLADGQHLLHPTKGWERSVCTRDPDDGPWPPPLQDPYDVWLDTPLPHDCKVAICHRLSYMFGMPFIPDKIPNIHDGYLPKQFGYIPLQFLIHCCQNLRRGHAAPFVATSTGPLPADTRYLQRRPFQDRRITLITGDLNSLWHRDSIDTMYEWLRRGRRAEQPLSLQKHVVPDFGHQDLYWGVDAPWLVFPKILEGLRRS
jgi:pimeloyl-ACP methyl ester carboxylesterase